MMGNYEQLKTAVASIVRDNGAEEITGNVLQSVLISIINSVGSGAVFAGIATPSTSPSNPDPNMFYIAVEAGTYPNFNLTVTTGMCIFSNESGTWVGHELGVSSQFESGEYITEVSIIDTLEGAETDNLPTVGAVNGAVTAFNTAIATERQDRQEADGNQTVALNLEKTLRQQGDEANAASVGYYVCDTAAATAAKVVNASGYVLRIGGNIRIEMTHANTADNATLDINNTGAKALFYNGEQASASNSWEAGEVLTVYYDGTQYQCASGGGSADSVRYDNSSSGLNADNVQDAIDTVVDDIDTMSDILQPRTMSYYGVKGVGSANLDKSSVWFYFNYPVTAGQVIESVELPNAYTGNFILAFADATTQKVIAVETYAVSNSYVVVTDKQVPATSIIGIGMPTVQTTKYGDTNVGTVKFVAANSIVVGSSLSGSYQRGDMNLKINISEQGESLSDKVTSMEDDVVALETEVAEINDTLAPVQNVSYGVKGVGTDNLYYTSVWFYFNYTVSAGQVIESIELPSVYTGNFILAIANSGTQKVTEVNTYTVTASDTITLNKTITDAGILGFAANSSQLLKYGGTNVGTVKYVAVSNIAVGASLLGSYQRGDINIKVNISKTLPTFEERLETLEQESGSVVQPYGEVNIIPVLGQSLSLGIERSIPAIHTTPIFGGLMFSTGIYQVDSGIDQMTGIKNLAEGSSTIYAHPDYETSCWGTADAIKKRIIDKLGDNIETFYLTCGDDGSSIDEQFDSELQVLERTLNRVKALLPYKTVKMPCFCYIQGEADQYTGMDKEVYKTKLKAGREAVQNIAVNILQQTTPVGCILYQTIRGDYTMKNITMAHMELCRDEEYFAPSTSVYTLMDSPNNDRLHISNWGEYLLGQYQGIQFADWIYFGRKNVGVMPLNISASGTKITIKFKVSYPPLRFVTDWVTAVSNYGFTVMSNGSDIVSSVAITDSDTVEITCSQNVTSGDILYYGISLSSTAIGGSHNRASRGNLCDSQGELYTTQVVNDVDNQQTTVALNNYCYAFYETLTV